MVVLEIKHYIWRHKTYAHSHENNIASEVWYNQELKKVDGEQESRESVMVQKYFSRGNQSLSRSNALLKLRLFQSM